MQVTETKVSIINFIKHIHPLKVPAQSLYFSNTFGLGGMCLVLFALLLFSGSLMLFFYQPFPELAYESILTFQNDYIFGKFIRSIHFFSASLIVIIIFLHGLRVLFTSGYNGIRKFNWLIGLFVFFMILLSCFTGYLLPWDQISFWAVTICINILDYLPAGGLLKEIITQEYEVGANTLQIFYTLHTTIIPVLLIALLAVHFWKIRKAKGIVTSTRFQTNNEKKPVFVDTIPHLFLREGVVALVLVAVVMVLSALFSAPLEDIANAGLSPNPAKAPWYFAGLQELLLHFHPFFAAFLIPFGMTCFLIILPYLNTDSSQQGIWFISKKGQKAGILSFTAALLVTPLVIMLDEYLFNLESLIPDISQWLSLGLIPTGLTLFAIGLFIYLVKKKLNLNRKETIQTFLIFSISVFLVLTATGIWFRGENMKLMWVG